MSRKTSLRDFQAYLAGRLTDAAQGRGASSLLGIEAGGKSWLVDLADGGEIVPAPHLTQVPLTKPWFVGIANIRGNLYSVTDLAQYCGGQAIVQNAYARLLLVGSRYGVNAALLVSRLTGLKNPQDLVPAPADETMPSWGSECLADGQGVIWHKLSVRELLADKNFMNIGV